MNAVPEPIFSALAAHLSPILARAVIAVSVSRTGARIERLRPQDRAPLEEAIGRAVKLYIQDPDKLRLCLSAVSSAIAGQPAHADPTRAAGLPGARSPAPTVVAPVRSAPFALSVPQASEQEVQEAAAPVSSTRSSRLTMTVPIHDENDVVVARGRGREMTEKLGFSAAVQVKVATAISELARNIVQYAGQGEITMTAVLGAVPGLEVIARDDGPGIPNLPLVMSDAYRSKRGLGIGLKGTRKLMDEFEITAHPGEGTYVRVCKYLR